MSDNQLRDFLQGVIGAVEANSYETMCLYQEYTGRNVVWKERSDGLLEQVGKFGGMPVNICLTTAEVDGHKVLFYDPVSQVIHYGMIEDWLRENLPKSAFTEDAPVHLNKVNAMNFHNIFPYRK